MTRGAGVLVIAVIAAAALSAAAPLRMVVRPSLLAFAPADVEIRLQVEPGGRQREVLLEVDGPEFFRSSVFPIRSNGDAPTLQPPAWYRHVPSGEYAITATLTDCGSGGCGTRVQLARIFHRLLIRGIDDVPEEP